MFSNLFRPLQTLFARLIPAERPVASRTFQGPRSQAGVWVSEDVALTYSVVWACVRLISETIAALPWRCYQAANGGRELLEGTTDWLLHRQPNPEMSAFTFREVLLHHVLLWGNAYAEIERDGANRPAWLWPLPPDRVTPDRDPAGKLVYRVRSTQKEAVLLPENVLHFKGLGFDGICGYSPVAMARQSIGMGLATEAYGARLFRNGARMGGILSYPGRFKDPETGRKLSASFDAATSGDNAHKTITLEEGMKWQQTSFNPDDAQFLETRKFQVAEICRWFRVPPHKVADLERATFSNIEHQSIEFVTDTILPWVTRFEQEADLKLFGRGLLGHAYTKFNLRALLRGDAASRGAYYKTLFETGVFSPNEIRELEEMNPLGEEGDHRFVQVNLQTLEQAAEAKEPAPAESTAPLSTPVVDDSPDEAAADPAALEAA